MSESLTDRIKNSKRQQVQRSDDLLPPVASEAAAIEPDPQPATVPAASVSPIERKVQKLIEELQAIPEISSKTTTLYLEEELGEEISASCKNYTLATFLEAAFVVLQQHPGIYEKVKVEAKRRTTLRRKGGRLQRQLTELGIKTK